MIDEFHETISVANNTGPMVVIVKMPGNGNSKRRLEAWIGSANPSNVYVFEGIRNREECEKEVKEAGLVNCLTCLTQSATIVPFDDDAQELTFFFEAENKAGQNQTVSMKVLENC